MENQTDVQLPRGIRTNNPGNLRCGVRYEGSRAGADGYLYFYTPMLGLRAEALCLWTYAETHGRRTVAKIITAWAPPAENATSAYIRAVCIALGIPPSDAARTIIHIENPSRLIALMDAINRWENGVPPQHWPSWPNWYCTREYIAAINAAGKWGHI